MEDTTRRRVSELLFALGVGVACIGGLRAIFEPGAYDPLVARGVLVAWLVGLGAMLRTDVAEDLHGPLLQGVALYATAWSGLLSWGNAFSGTVAPAIIPVCALGILVFRRSRSAAIYLLAAASGLVIAGWHAGALGPAMGVALSAIATGGVVLGAILQREALTHALVEHRAELEAEVETRTAELRREVVVRRAAEFRALAASEAKSKFLANMSHELRTPLNAIIGYSELVREELADPEGSTKDARSDLRRVIRAAERLLALVNDVLDLARIEADMMEILPAPMVLPDLIGEVCDEVRPLASSNGNDLITDFSEAPQLMRSDAARLRQILVNLVTNAAKFTRDGRIEVRASSHDQTVRIDVIDDGIGIPEEAMASLFDRFTQVDDSSTRVFGGTGLGLALSRDLARRMGGELFATSQHGEGSTFTLLMPIDAESTAHLRQAMESSSDDSHPGGARPTLRMVGAGGA